MANLKNGTLNYFLTKDLDALENRENALKEMNKMDPTYPDPNDPRFTDPAPVFTILDNQLYRDGVAIGKIYNNKTGKVVEITETTETGFKYKDTGEDAIITKDVSIGVVEKLTGLKGEIVEETRLVVYYDIQDISYPTTIWTNYDGGVVKSIEVDGVLLDSVVTTYQFNSIGEHVIKFEFYNPTIIGNNAPLFYNVTNAKRIVIPNIFTAIGANAFNGCSELTTITISENITSIGNAAFRNCANLTNITIPNSVISIGNDAFSNCTGLTSVTIGKSVTSIGGAAFQYCYSLINIIIPDSVTNINTDAFNNCTGLTSVTIGNGVTNIGSNTFYYCPSLTNITIGSGVTNIGEAAFSNCLSLINVTIPSSVTNIDNRAFNGCSNLTSITSLATIAPTIQSNTFFGVKTGGTLTVPQGSTGYDAWMSTDNFYLGSYNWTKVELS